MKNGIILIAKRLFPVLKKYIPLVFKKIVSLLSPKFLVVMGAVVLVVAILYFGFGGGFGGGNGNENGEGNTKVTEATLEEMKEKPTDKNADDSKGAILAITIVGNDYFYQNERMDLETLLDTIKQVESNFVVEITDDNASLRAYNDLIDKLEKSYIRYVEK